MNVEKIPRWRRGECPSDEFQHHFKKVTDDASKLEARGYL